MPALESCEAELDQLVHLPLAVDNKSAPTEPETTRPTEGPLRHASLALGEKFTVESIVNGAMSPQRSPRSRSGSSKSGGTVALTLVMRSTRETTDFVASVLIWALKRDPSSHPASTAWQRNLEVFRGDESLWSPSFRRLQEPLRKELFESVRDAAPKCPAIHVRGAQARGGVHRRPSRGDPGTRCPRHPARRPAIAAIPRQSGPGIDLPPRQNSGAPSAHCLAAHIL